MKCRKLQPQHHGWIESILDKEFVDFLWGRIEKSEHDVKDRLAGNISTSRAITDDEDGTFLNRVLLPQVEMYRVMNQGRDPVPIPINAEIELYIHDLWVNYQYKHEFNPYHFHGGMYSFVVWMKIPTDWKEQNKLPFLDGIREEDKKVGCFEFQHLDMYGDVVNTAYRLDPSYEGYMVFFPAKLRHMVYPFYETEEPRISIAGNIWCRTQA